MTDIGINFRATAGYVTDGAGETHCLNDAYPKTRGGVTFGWSGTVSPRDRSTGVDVRLAGTNFSDESPVRTFRLDITAGNHDITFAAGEPVYDPSPQWIDMKDDTTRIFLIDDVDPGGGGSHVDAEGTGHATADWPSNNVPVNHTFVSTILRFEQANGDPGYTNTAHVALAEVGAPNVLFPVRVM